MPTTLRRTPLHDAHVAAGARLVEFAGWEMPLQYEGVLAEHMAVRERCGIFDVSHMGELEVEGMMAHDVLQAALSNDVDAIALGEAQYTLLTNERGGIVDDLIVYRLEDCRYLLIVNAANAQTDFEWLKEREIRGSDVRDVSEDYALLAVQGPRAIERLGLPPAKPFTFADAEIDGATGILLNITGPPDIGLFEVNEAAEVVTSAADQNANVIFGAVIDDAIGEDIRVTVIATGFGGGRRRRRREAGVTGPSGPTPQPAPTGPERFEVSDEVLEVPSFLRDE